MIWNSTLSFVISLAVMTIVVAWLCVFAYDDSLAKKRIHRRVDLLMRLRQERVRPGRRRNPDPASQLTATTLRGADLEFARWLAQLRIPVAYASSIFLLVRLAGALLMAALFGLLGHLNFAAYGVAALFGFTLIGGAVGWRLPQFFADRMALHRRRAIARGLPDAIELLVIAVEAGLSLELAIDRVIVELRRSQPAIAQELTLTSADLRILPNRDDALRRLAQRAELPSMNSVVTTLSQTLRYGTPLAQALRVVAAELRNEALMRLEEQVNRLPVMLTIPMIIFMLPALLLIIGGPAALRVLDVLAH